MDPTALIAKIIRLLTVEQRVRIDLNNEKLTIRIIDREYGRIVGKAGAIINKLRKLASKLVPGLTIELLPGVPNDANVPASIRPPQERAEYDAIEIVEDVLIGCGVEVGPGTVDMSSSSHIEVGTKLDDPALESAIESLVYAMHKVNMQSKITILWRQ